jgi:hypothetical protein
MDMEGPQIAIKNELTTSDDQELVRPETEE